jgi:hypothetical protein
MLAQQVIPQQQQPNTRSSKKRKGPPKTTGRGKQSARVNIKIRTRVKIPRFQLFHILESDEQRSSIPKDIPNKYMFFGTVVSRGKGKSSWNVKFDVLPIHQNIVHNITRTKLTVVDDGEEEKALQDNEQLDEVAYNSDATNDDAASPDKSSRRSNNDKFCDMDRQSILAAETYRMVWGNTEADAVEWRILKDGELFQLKEDTFTLPESVEYNEDLTDIELDDPSDFFFKYIFPDLTGKFMF